MINHITKNTTGNKVNYSVYYENGRVFRYDENSNLPLKVIEILINGTNYDTTYTEYGKIERFR